MLMTETKDVNKRHATCRVKEDFKCAKLPSN